MAIGQDTKSDLTKTAEILRGEIMAAIKFNICSATNGHLQRVLAGFILYTSEVREELEQQASDKGGDL